MQSITLNIDNPQIESVLLRLSEQFNKSVEQVAVDLLKQVSDSIATSKDAKLKYKTFDAEQLMTKIDYDTDYSDIPENTTPYDDVENSAVYIRNLRQHTWKR